MGSNVTDVPPRTKKLDRKYIEHLAGILRPIVAKRFDGNGTSFAKHVGISQPQIAQLLRTDGGDRGVGIVVLIQLRKYLGLTLDEMLGLPPLPARAVPVDELEAAVARALERKFPQPAEPAPPTSTELPALHSSKRKKLE